MASKSDLNSHREEIDGQIADLRREQSERNTRLENKIDDMHRDITTRIDRLFSMRGSG